MKTFKNNNKRFVVKIKTNVFIVCKDIKNFLIHKKSIKKHKKRETKMFLFFYRYTYM